MRTFPTQRIVRSLLSEHGIAPQKRWGQNFLIDQGYAQRIVGLLESPAGSRVWEIGPGVGALTGLLLNRGLHVTAFEIDWGLIRVLQERFAQESALRIHQGDAARTWIEERRDTGDPSAILGNLPYRSASAIIGSLAEARYLPGRCVFTVQREVAERMISPPGTGTFSGFSVIIQTAARVWKEFDLPAGAFYPVPEVKSSVLVCEPRSPGFGGSDPRGGRHAGSGLMDADSNAAAVVEDPPLDDGEWAVLIALVRSLFQERRKVLRKTLTRFLAEGGKARAGQGANRSPGSGPYASTSPQDLLEACGATGEDRPENLTVAQFRCLAKAIAGRPAN